MPASSSVFRLCYVKYNEFSLQVTKGEGEQEKKRRENLFLRHDCFIMRPSVQADKLSRGGLLWYFCYISCTISKHLMTEYSTRTDLKGKTALKLQYQSTI